MPHKNDPLAVRRFGRYERAAREYCRRKGIDPDEFLSHGSPEFSDAGPGFYTGEVRYTERWLFVARNLARYEERLETDKMMAEILQLFPPDADKKE